MSAPKEAIHRVTWDSGLALFHCDGDATSPCRTYPDCGCEEWYLDETGKHPHPSVIQDECWKLPWLDASDAVDTYDGDDYADGGGPQQIDAEIETTWDGDCLTWDYATEPAAS